METNPTVTIDGDEYTIGPATIGHIEAIAPVAELFCLEDEPGVEQAIQAAGDLTRAVAVLTGCPRDIVARQDLVEFVRIVEETAAGWIDRNAEYIRDQVVPAIEDLRHRADNVTRAAAEADDGGKPPAAA